MQVAVSPKDQFICTGGDDQKVVSFCYVLSLPCSCRVMLVLWGFQVVQFFTCSQNVFCGAVATLDATYLSQVVFY